ncbi:MAG: hypothetical protein QXL14_03495 [Candidatus Aenigmatarchaeota archaeon]
MELTEVQIKPLLFTSAIVKKYDLTIVALPFTYEGPNISMLAKNIKKIISSALEVKEEDIKESAFSLSRGEKEKMKADYKLTKLIDRNCYYRFEISVYYECNVEDVGKFEASIKGALYFELPQETAFQRSLLYHFFFSLYWNFFYSDVIKKYQENGKEYLKRFISYLEAQVSRL